VLVNMKRPILYPSPHPQLGTSTSACVHIIWNLNVFGPGGVYLFYNIRNLTFIVLEKSIVLVY